MTMMTSGPTLLVQDPGCRGVVLVFGTPMAGLEGKKPVRKVEKRTSRSRNLITGWWTEGDISKVLI